MSIVRAIVDGERNPQRLAELRDPRCKKSVSQIAEHLKGHWRDEHLFNLKMALDLYDHLMRSLGVSQHVRVSLGEAGPFATSADQVLNSVPGERLVALGDEEPGQGACPGAQVAPDCPELVAGDRVLEGEAVLQPGDPDLGLVEIQVAELEGERLRDPKSVAVHEEHEKMVPDTVPGFLGGFQKALHLLGGEEVFGPFGAIERPTLTISPFGTCAPGSHKSLWEQYHGFPTLSKIRVLVRVDTRRPHRPSERVRRSTT
jgi:hypothetical protein